MCGVWLVLTACLRLLQIQTARCKCSSKWPVVEGRMLAPIRAISLHLSYGVELHMQVPFWRALVGDPRPMASRAILLRLPPCIVKLVDPCALECVWLSGGVCFQ